MYEFLDGTVASQAAARLVLDVGGVGFDIAVPLGARFPAAGRARVWTHLVVREDAHLLFGFPERETREIFRALLSVRGVGPVLALSILSGLSAEEFLAALLADDAAALTRVRGVGRKTAEQILLDLRGKAPHLRTRLGAPGAAAGSAAPERQLSEDAVNALLSIGFSEKEARKNVEKAAARGSSSSLEDLVRAALSS